MGNATGVYLQVLLVGVVFFAAILPQYVTTGGAPASVQMGLLGLVFVSIALLSDGCGGSRRARPASGSRVRRVGWPGWVAPAASR